MTGDNDPKQPEIESMYKPGDGPREGEKSDPEFFIITASEIENEFKKIPNFDFLAYEKIYNDAKLEAAQVDSCLLAYDLEGANRHAQKCVELIKQAWEVS